MMWEVRTLESLSLHTLLSSIERYKECLPMLPRNLKLKLLHLLSKRGLLDDFFLKQLVNKAVVELDLTESTLSDNGLKHLKICKNLEKLDLNSLNGNRTDITSGGMVQMLPNLINLRILYLRRCAFVDDRVICIASKLQNLTELNLGGCPLITDVSVEALSSHSRNLQCLNLTRTKVSDIGLLYISNGVFKDKLREVQVTFCPYITDDGLTDLSRKCSSLAILTFHGCPKVSLNFDLDLNMNSNKESGMKTVTWTVY